MGTPTAGGVRKERCGGIPGTAVRDGGDAARPPPVRSVTLVKLPPVLRARFAVSPERTGVEEGNEPFLGGTPHPTPTPPPRCPSAGPGRSGGTGPLEPGAGRLPGKRRCRLRSAPCSEGDVGVRCPGTAGTGGDAPRKAPTHT